MPAAEHAAATEDAPTWRSVLEITQALNDPLYRAEVMSVFRTHQRDPKAADVSLGWAAGTSRQVVASLRDRKLRLQSQSLSATTETRTSPGLSHTTSNDVKTDAGVASPSPRFTYLDYPSIDREALADLESRIEAWNTQHPVNPKPDDHAIQTWIADPDYLDIFRSVIRSVSDLDADTALGYHAYTTRRVLQRNMGLRNEYTAFHSPRNDDLSERLRQLTELELILRREYCTADDIFTHWRTNSASVPKLRARQRFKKHLRDELHPYLYERIAASDAFFDPPGRRKCNNRKTWDIAADSSHPMKGMADSLISFSEDGHPIFQLMEREAAAS